MTVDPLWQAGALAAGSLRPKPGSATLAWRRRLEGDPYRCPGRVPSSSGRTGTVANFILALSKTSIF
jgi:hypothetical protein